MYIGILNGEWGSVLAKQLTLKDLTIGISVVDNSSINLDQSSMQNNKIAVKANGSAATVELLDVDITVPNNGKGLFTTKEAMIQMQGIDKSDAGINFTVGSAVYMRTGEVYLEKVNIINNSTQDSSNQDNFGNTAVYMYPQSNFDMEEGKIHLNSGHAFTFKI
ncbi:MAG: hypothetical protein PV353_12095, partial [Bartonella sp.]|nr:hypothetical protein [Bartonella sp.]